MTGISRLHSFIVATMLLGGNCKSTLADTNQTDAARWWESAGPVPAFTVPASLREWEIKRKTIRAELVQLLGRLPPRPKAPKVEILSREDRGAYRLEKFQFDNGAGATVPGYLLLPRNAPGPSPAILYCHWHGGEYEIGKEELFQARHTPVPPGPALAQRGYVVMAIDAYCFGERDGRGPGGPTEKGSAGEMTASKFNLWIGRTLWGMMLRDDLMALDYLASRPEVDQHAIGVTGMSLGATRSWWLMALDDRLKTGVPIDCLTRYQNLIARQNLKAHGIYYFVPQSAESFRYRGHRGLACAASGAVPGRRSGSNLAGRWHPRHRIRRPPRLSALPAGGRFSKHRLSKPGPRLHIRDVGKDAGVVR